MFMGEKGETCPKERIMSKRSKENKKYRRGLRKQAVEACRKKLGTLETDYIQIAKRICFDLGRQWDGRSQKALDKLLSDYSGIKIIDKPRQYWTDKPTKSYGSYKKSNKGFYESDAWMRLRYEALKKYGRKCSCCGAMPPDVVLHVDHIKPRSKYPELELDINNLQILCKHCNLGKSNTDCIDYRS